MRFASALTTTPSTDEALRDVCQQVSDCLDAPPDLALLFVSADHAENSDALAKEACAQLGTTNLIGCTAESLVGIGREIEWQSGMSLWAACLPDVVIRPMHLTFENTADGGSIIGWPDELIDQWPDPSTMFMLSDPFSFPADAMLERLNADHPGQIVIGGMSSGGSAPGECRLFSGPQSLASGAVAVMLNGNVRIRSIVSQGCRPIGRPMVVTRAERNVVFELGGKPALLQLKELFDELPTSEQQQVQQGLHLGRVVSEFQDQFEQGDFLVRNVMGIDPDNHALVTGDFFRVGQTVQFHIRDSQSADQEMQSLLAKVRDEPSASPLAALLFTCNGRGTRLFDQPHHDAGLIQETLGEVPLSGFFAAGEVGPVAGKNFVHGFTASIALFES